MSILSHFESHQRDIGVEVLKTYNDAFLFETDTSKANNLVNCNGIQHKIRLIHTFKCN